MDISVVSPVYMASGIVDELVSRIKENLSTITTDFEIVLVEDGSPDNSWEEIEKNCKKDKRVKGIKLTRNFGQHYALSCGLKYTEGNYVVVIDCDLQDDPKYIRDLYKKALEGFDVVYAKKNKRSHNFFKNLTASLYYKILSFISDYDMDPTMGSFSILSRRVVDSFLRFNDYRRCYRMVLTWLGYKYSYVYVDHTDRFKGKSSYSFKKLIEQATENTILYSSRLLQLSIYIGILFSTLSVIGVIYLIYQYFFIGYKEGWTSLMVMIFLVGGLILLSLGIMGLYIGAIFEQVKGRPLFLIDETLNCQEEKRYDFKQSELLTKPR